MLMGEEDHSGTVFYRGQYVCDSGWGPEEAKVVCRELGYTNDDDGYVPRATRNSNFGQPNQNGASSWFKCSGSEQLLSECKKMTGGRFCPPSHAAGVFPATTVPAKLSSVTCSGGQSSILGCEHVLTEDTHEYCYNKKSSSFGKYTVGLRCEK